jgi:hypothetical protein
MFGFDIFTTLMLGVSVLYFVWSSVNYLAAKHWRNSQYGRGGGPTIKELAGEYKVPVKYYKSIAWCGSVTIVLTGLLFTTATFTLDSFARLLFPIMAGNMTVGGLAFLEGSVYVRTYVEREIAQNSTSSRQ